jgi:hypothetical protein
MDPEGRPAMIGGGDGKNPSCFFRIHIHTVLNLAATAAEDRDRNAQKRSATASMPISGDRHQTNMTAPAARSGRNNPQPTS